MNELKGFEKVPLEPGESKQVKSELNKRGFAYYNTEIGDWHAETGDFEVRLRNFITFSCGQMSEEFLRDLIDQMNGLD